MRRTGALLLFGIALAALGAVLVAPTMAVGAKPGTELDLALCDPRQNTFGLTIDNGYFPLPVGQQWIFQGKEQGQPIGLRTTVLNETETFYSGRRTVTTRVVEEVEWEDANRDGIVDEDENLLEISRNFFAQTQNGTAPSATSARKSTSTRAESS